MHINLKNHEQINVSSFKIKKIKTCITIDDEKTRSSTFLVF